MRRYRARALLSLAVAVAACSAAGENTTASISEATGADILRLDSLWEAVEASRDTAAQSALMADKFVIRFSGFVQQKAEYLAQVANDSTRYIRRGSTGGYAIVHGPTAVSGGLYAASSLNGADTLTFAARWTTTWVRSADGKWRALATLEVPVPARKALPLAPGDSARLVGAYDFPEGAVTIAVQDGRLVMRFPGRPDMHLANQGGGVFVIEEVESTELHFPTTESPVSGLTIESAGTVIPIKRKR